MGRVLALLCSLIPAEVFRHHLYSLHTALKFSFLIIHFLIAILVTPDLHGLIHAAFLYSSSSCSYFSSQPRASSSTPDAVRDEL